LQIDAGDVFTEQERSLSGGAGGRRSDLTTDISTDRPQHTIVRAA